MSKLLHTLLSDQLRTYPVPVDLVTQGKIGSTIEEMALNPSTMAYLLSPTKYREAATKAAEFVAIHNEIFNRAKTQRLFQLLIKS